RSPARGSGGGRLPPQQAEPQLAAARERVDVGLSVVGGAQLLPGGAQAGGGQHVVLVRDAQHLEGGLFAAVTTGADAVEGENGELLLPVGVRVLPQGAVAAGQAGMRLGAEEQPRHLRPDRVHAGPSGLLGRRGTSGRGSSSRPSCARSQSSTGESVQEVTATRSPSGATATWPASVPGRAGASWRSPSGPDANSWACSGSEAVCSRAVPVPISRVPSGAYATSRGRDSVPSPVSMRCAEARSHSPTGPAGPATARRVPSGASASASGSRSRTSRISPGEQAAPSPVHSRTVPSAPSETSVLPSALKARSWTPRPRPPSRGGVRPVRVHSTSPSTVATS